MITSSPMIARLPSTRPAISVTVATSWAGRDLCMIANSDSIISAKRSACFARPVSGETETTPSPCEAEVAEVAREERQRGHVVDRDREEALDLAGVEVHRQDPVGAGDLQHVGDEAGGDRLARLRLAVLAGVGEERDHRGDPLRRAELRRLDHLQQLHQVPVDRLAAGLDEEEVGAADRLVVADCTSRRSRSLGRRPRRARRRAARRSRSASSGCERPANTIRRFCGPRSIQWPGCGSLTTARSDLVEPRKHELTRPAAELHTPPCSPGGRGRSASAPAGTSFVIVDPAAVHAPSPTSTGATKPFWIPVLTFLPIRRALLRGAGLVREVRGDRPRRRYSCPRRSRRRRCTTDEAPWSAARCVSS